MDAGATIRQARERHGVSQRQLAVRAQTSQGYVSQVERGEVSPSVEAVARLLACLGEQGHVQTGPLPPLPLPDGPDADDLRPGSMLAALSARDVDLIVVGALAARAHGVQLPAAAVVVTLDPAPVNQQGLARALGDLQARMAQIAPAANGSRALAGGATFTFATSEGPLVLAPSEVRYLALARRSTIAKVGGVAVRCAGRDDLIARARPGGANPDLALLAALTAAES